MNEITKEDSKILLKVLNVKCFIKKKNKNAKIVELFNYTFNLIQQIFCLIAEPQTGFRIAFNMFDTDGNERVDKTEFLVVSWIKIFDVHTKLFNYVQLP